MSAAQLLHGPLLQSVAHSLLIFLGMCHSYTRPDTSLHVTSCVVLVNYNYN